MCSPLNAVNDLGRMTVSLSGQWGRVRGYASRTTSILRFCLSFSIHTLIKESHTMISVE